VRQRGPPGRRQPNLARQAFQQRATQIAFQRLDLVGQARLGDMQYLRSPW
jgi:hypothetical protein